MANVAPSIITIDAPTNPVAVGTAVTILVSFDDPSADNTTF